MEAVNPPIPQLPIGEVIKLAATNSELYARTFFPKTFRQKSPDYQREVWNDLENPDYRYVNQIIFRGGAKTTISRTFTSKRIAYGVSKTIVYVGSSETSAARSGNWIRTNVERNKLWAGAFGLSPGSKWTDTEFQIQHNVLKDAQGNPLTIWCMFVGITGNIRGINFDDYRPDLIVLDDIITDENASSEEQRQKINDLVQTALRPSLAPKIDEPNAKMVMLVTPQNKEDVSALCEADPIWKTTKIGIWTKETMDLPVDQQVSVWPERLPTEDMRKEKLSFIQRNELSKFMREYEVRLVSRESAAFRGEWLNYYTSAPLTTNVLSVDPVPPPSDRELAKGLSGKDFEAIHVWGRDGDNYYLRESRTSRGHTPDWSIANILEMALKWRVTQIVVEGVAYQKTLKWLLEQEMNRRRLYFLVNSYMDRRPKFARITSTFAGPASHGHIFVNANDHVNFITQFESYPSVDHDDELDAGAMALSVLINPYAAGEQGTDGFAKVEPLRLVRGAP